MSGHGARRPLTRSQSLALREVPLHLIRPGRIAKVMRRFVLIALGGLLGLAAVACEDEARPPTTAHSAPPAKPAEVREEPRLSPGEIAGRAAASVVVVETPEALGAGFVAPGGRVVTCFHVVAGAQSVTVRTADGARHSVTSVASYDPRVDVAVLIVPNLTAPSLRFGDSGDIEVGDGVTVIGHPEGLEDTVSTGIVSQVRERGGVRQFQITAPISHGSSGGPMFNEFGQVVGIARSGLSSGQALNFATPGKYIRALLKRRNDSRSIAQFASLTRPPAPAQAQSSPIPPTPRPSFPGTVAGFSFGMTNAQLARLCPQGWSDQAMAECPSPPVLPFAIEKVLMSLAYGRVTSVNLMLAPGSFGDVARALTDKYGTPSALLEWRNGKWRSTAEFTKQTRVAIQWDFEHGSFIRLGEAHDKKPFAAFVSARKIEIEEGSY